jgi:2-C-methyl-D-erythritol 2,4-cyclodiphosphate synthase
MYRIGYGFDVHRLKKGEALVLGGIEIPSGLGTVAHSDGDVLAHALCDALLGALALGDIGTHFPDTDPQYKNIDSCKLLEKTMKIVRGKGYELANCDTTLCLEQPKLKPHIPEMREKLARAMAVAPGKISVKTTTTEKLGYTGRGEGVAAHASVLLEKKDPR